MASNDAIQLLENRLAVSSGRSDLALLAEALNFTPLALTQAAAYINHRSPQWSVARYLDRLNLGDASQARLLTCVEGDTYLDSEAERSILPAWKISFDHISQLSPSAAELLLLMSFFDRQAIQGFLLQVKRTGAVTTLQQSASRATESASQATDGLLDNGNIMADSDFANDDRVNQEIFEDNMTTLIDFSFVSRTTDEIAGLGRLLENCGGFLVWENKFKDSESKHAINTLTCITV